ncbi:unnamed protein product, partial [Mesorhabditis spiculigera]
MIIVVVLESQRIRSEDLPSRDQLRALRQDASLFGINVYGSAPVAKALLEIVDYNLEAYDVMRSAYYLYSPYRLPSWIQLKYFLKAAALAETGRGS